MNHLTVYADLGNIEAAIEDAGLKNVRVKCVERFVYDVDVLAAHEQILTNELDSHRILWEQR